MFYNVCHQGQQGTVYIASFQENPTAARAYFDAVLQSLPEPEWHWAGNLNVGDLKRSESGSVRGCAYTEQGALSCALSIYLGRNVEVVDKNGA